MNWSWQDQTIYIYILYIYVYTQRTFVDNLVNTRNISIFIFNFWRCNQSRWTVLLLLIHLPRFFFHTICCSCNLLVPLLHKDKAKINKSDRCIYRCSRDPGLCINNRYVIGTSSIWDRDVRRWRGMKEAFIKLTERRLVQCPHLTVTTIDRLVNGTLTC